jgi:ATP-dependent Lhr-like helicase
LLAISAADPLNLVGIVLPGQRVPALTGNRVLYRDGQVLAVSVAGKIQIWEEMDEAAAWEVSNALLPNFGRVKRMNMRV